MPTEPPLAALAALPLLGSIHLGSFMPADLLVVLVLVVLEGLLSCDNAVVLALLVKDLPEEERGKALRYGIIGAYVFRIAALLVATWILSRWYLKVAGGAYLLFMSLSHVLKKKGDGDEAGTHEVKARFGLSPFWSTVVAVEVTDIVFSVDSIAAAVALSDKLWVLIAGGLLGILAMRFAAQLFVTLLERFPRLEGAAFVAVGFIGLKLLLEFPVDVAGRTYALPDGASYADAKSYVELVDRTHTPPLHIDHVISVSDAAPPPPERERFAGDEEHAEAEFSRAWSAWNLRFRPMIELEGWVSSLIVITIFGLGFVGGGNRPKEA